MSSPLDAQRPLVRRMTGRSPHETHRVATPLELLFDLVFVVAVARAAHGLHHAVAAQHAMAGFGGYLMVFFAIWWAWMNFSWFASAFDTDDVPYRLLVFAQIGGALILAAGVPAMLETRTPNLAVVSGYVVMRLAFVPQWLRAAASDPAHRVTALRMAIGITLVQIAWVGLVFLPPLSGPAFAALFLTLVVAELLVPLWGERAAATPWHPHHIAERYGLFTLIVFGETIAATTIAVESALDGGARLGSLAPIAVSGLTIVFALWWIYFDRPMNDLLTSLRRAIVWGYGHYVVFAAAAAVGAGLAVEVDRLTGRSTISAAAGGLAVAIPVAVFLVAIWILHVRPIYRSTRWFGPIAALLVLGAAFTGRAVPGIALILVATLVVKAWVMRRGTTVR
jgi:low temperature requirement protein LtrA